MHDLKGHRFNLVMLIGYLVKRLREEYPQKQIGKTTVQKMMFLLSRRGLTGARYNLYYYGPYSSQIEGATVLAEENGIISTKWVDDRGFFIEPLNPGSEVVLEPEVKTSVDELVKKHGNRSATELSLLCTAIFLKDNHKVSDGKLIQILKDVKPNAEPDALTKAVQQARAEI